MVGKYTQCGGLLYTQSLLKNKLNLNRKKLTVRIMDNGKKNQTNKLLNRREKKLK
jgi:hypothetical protein